MKLNERPTKFQNGDKSIARIPYTINPGDRINKNKSIDEKAKQVAVEAPDITGDHIKVPTYFVFDMPNGEKKALHHVKDAKEISDLIRQAFFYEEYENQPPEVAVTQFNVTATILIIVSFLLTLPILVGIF